MILTYRQVCDHGLSYQAQAKLLSGRGHVIGYYVLGRIVFSITNSTSECGQFYLRWITPTESLDIVPSAWLQGETIDYVPFSVNQWMFNRDGDRNGDGIGDQLLYLGNGFRTAMGLPPLVTRNGRRPVEREELSRIQEAINEIISFVRNHPLTVNLEDL